MFIRCVCSCAQTYRWWSVALFLMKKKVFFSFWLTLSRFTFVFVSKLGHNSLCRVSALSSDLDHVWSAACARLYFGFSFCLRCFPVILSCVHRLKIMSSLCRMPATFFLFVFDRDKTVQSRDNRKGEKIRNGRQFFVYFHEVARSYCYCCYCCCHSRCRRHHWPSPKSLWSGIYYLMIMIMTDASVL